MNLENEIWKDIEGYQGYYQVSNYGRVKSLNRKINRGDGLFCINERLLKPTKTTGYCRVMLCKDNRMKAFQVHRLVSMAFIPNPEKSHK